ncbi:MAG: class I SAM-dependent methyltransferase [Planctomycetaceae bacterium]|jgi:tRNA (cmo5U34)-methyltransferase|nr:class I SAM-dependent methyltransferase [Planctomycetaceae bacterium]
MKSTTDEIRQRFDNDVERFANLDTGQISTIDPKYSLELLTEAAKILVPNAENLLDIGCGAGNYTLTMLQKIPNLNCTLVDLSQPMLNKAFERISTKTNGKVQIIQCDIRNVILSENHFDIILAGAVLHHLRENSDWENVFKKLYNFLKPKGCLMISDLITQDNNSLTEFFQHRYAEYLEKAGGKEFCQNIIKCIEKEDTPRSITYQIELMKKAGFKDIEILHKNICYASWGGIK